MHKGDDFIKDEIIKYQETGTISNDLAMIFFYVATKYANVPRYDEWPDDLKDDMIAHAVLQMIKSCNKVNTDRGMMFAYIGTVARCSFAYVISKNLQQERIVEDKAEYDSCGGDENENI